MELHELNEDLKKRIDILEKENEALKIRQKEENQIDSESQIENKENFKIIKMQSCGKCGLHFSGKEKLNKHKDEMHRAKLTF